MVEKNDSFENRPLTQSFTLDTSGEFHFSQSSRALSSRSVEGGKSLDGDEQKEPHILDTSGNSDSVNMMNYKEHSVELSTEAQRSEPGDDFKYFFEHHANICKLFEELHAQNEFNETEEIQQLFIKGFFEEKLKQPLSQCPVDSLFWDWIYSFYPDNFDSPHRFASFSKQFVNFLLEHRRFAEAYGEWIEQNEDSLANLYFFNKSSKVAPSDVSMHASIFKSIINEKLRYGIEKGSYLEYAPYTVDNKAPEPLPKLVREHKCGLICGAFGVSHLIFFRNREYLRANFTRLFSKRFADKTRPDEFIHKPISKLPMQPMLSRLKGACKQRLEEVLTKALLQQCPSCLSYTQLHMKEQVEQLASLFGHLIDSVYETTFKSCPSVFRVHK